MAISVPSPSLGPFSTWDDLSILAATVFGEARGEPVEGQIAVAHVVLERVDRNGWYGSGVRGVCLKPLQFSCFRDDVALRKALAAEPTAWVDCFRIAAGALFGWLDSPVPGATSYHNLTVHPPWANKLIYLTQLGNHRFYRDGDALS